MNTPFGTNARRSIPFNEALRFWMKLGLISFGGPTGQIAIMHTEVVERRKWISEARFLHALNYCMLLPGPEAQQLAIYIGWLLHRTRGGLAAGALFVLPSIVVLWSLSYVYAAYGSIFWIASVFYGLKAGVMAIVAAAVIRIGRKALKNAMMWILAAAAFVSLFFFHVPFPWIILGAGMIGFLGKLAMPEQFLPAMAPIPSSQSVIDDHTEPHDEARPSLSRALLVTSVSLILWWSPVLLSGILLGWNHSVFHEGIFFSKAAMVTFGGAYAVLPYVSQQAVEHYGWLQASQMMDGLGLAETTPGPLIMVVQFVGFMGGWNQPGELPQWLAATMGALITTWVTFVPCFLWIFLGAPHIEQLRGNKALTSALSAITAAVVGVVLNLAVWFAIHALFPHGKEIDWFVLLLSFICFISVLRLRWNVVLVVVVSGLLGFLYRL